MAVISCGLVGGVPAVAQARRLGCEQDGGFKLAGGWRVGAGAELVHRVGRHVDRRYAATLA